MALAGIFGPSLAHAASPAITLSAAVEPPTGTVIISGSGFSANEAIDITWDGIFQAIKGTDTTGAFAYAFTVPATATPGEHLIGARGERDGLYADTSILVRSDWAGFRNDSRRRGVQAYENVLNSSNVSGIDMDWRQKVGGHVESSPAISGGVLYEGADNGRSEERRV